MHPIWVSKSDSDVLQSSSTFLPVLSRAYTLAGAAATKSTVPAASPAGFMISSAQESQKSVAMYSPGDLIEPGLFGAIQPLSQQLVLCLAPVASHAGHQPETVQYHCG